MKWLKFRIETTEEAEDILISDLYDCGLEGAQIEDKQPLSALDKERMFVDILPDVLPDDGKAYLSFFVEAPAGDEEKKNLTDETLAKIKEVLDDNAAFFDIGSGKVEISETEDIDWINNWKQYFHQFYVDDILVIPSWENASEEDKDRMILHIDPGTAFGTGMHETTQLCIRQLRKYVNSSTTLLDVGIGSGIAAVADNLEQNNVDKNDFDLIIGNVIGDENVCESVLDSNNGSRFDIVSANILADVLVPLTPVVVRFIKKNGVFITSGIIDGKEDLVAETMKANGFDVVDISAQGEWHSVTGIYKG